MSDIDPLAPPLDPASGEGDSGGDIISLRICVPPMCDGWRLDHFLKWRIGRLSRTRIQDVIAEQITFADGRRVRSASRVRVGEIVHLDRPAPIEPDVPRYFSVLAEDEHYLAIEKPAGLPMHATAKFWKNTLTAVLRERYPDEHMQICHRLDRETSGVLLVARTAQAASFLMKAFEHRKVQKSYLALVHGHLDPAHGTVDAPMKLVESRTHMMMGIMPDGMHARTRYTTLEQYPAHALILAEPETGRQHQIRLHCAHLGHPIVGDKMYKASEADFMAYCDSGMTPELLAKFDHLPRHALHAHKLVFPHPITREMTTIQSPLPADLGAYIDSTCATVRATGDCS